MTSVSTKIAPPYSIVFIADPKDGGEVPKDTGETLIAATDSCVAVGCLCEMDGLTELTLGPTNEVDPGRPPSFTGRLKTPSRLLPKPRSRC